MVVYRVMGRDADTTQDVLSIYRDSLEDSLRQTSRDGRLGIKARAILHDWDVGCDLAPQMMVDKLIARGQVVIMETRP